MRSATHAFRVSCRGAGRSSGAPDFLQQQTPIVADGSAFGHEHSCFHFGFSPWKGFRNCDYTKRKTGDGKDGGEILFIQLDPLLC
jgi:hypothetical protein